MTTAKPDFVMTASGLQKEFEDDETAASAKYINKILEITGKITSVTPAENNVMSISLETASDFSSVICTFPAVTDPAALIVGNVVTLRGECSGFLLDVLLNNCALIDNRK